jgi:anti-sigma factor RsiW
MNPDKLFDYLDGKLSEDERTQLERQLASDTQLQRELAVAREIHRGMPESREVVGPFDSTATRGAILGRRIAVAFSVLVFLNVIFGIYAIAFMDKKRRARPTQEQNRQELFQSLQKTAAVAFPTPSFDIDEIKLSATAAEQDALANKVIAAAQQCGGSGTKGLTDEHGILLFAEVPSARLSDFRQLLKKFGAALPTPGRSVPAGEKMIVQIRIAAGVKPQ